MILQIVYGVKLESLEDEYIKLVERALQGANISAVPGKNWVEFIPFIQHIPSWVPGGRTRRLIDEYRPIVEAMIEGPLETVKKWSGAWRKNTSSVPESSDHEDDH